MRDNQAIMKGKWGSRSKSPGAKAALSRAATSPSTGAAFSVAMSLQGRCWQSWDAPWSCTTCQHGLGNILQSSNFELFILRVLNDEWGQKSKPRVSERTGIKQGIFLPHPTNRNLGTWRTVSLGTRWALEQNTWIPTACSPGSLQPWLWTLMVPGHQA